MLAGWAGAGGMFLGAAVLAAGGGVVMPALLPVAIDGVELHRRSSAIATFTMFVDVAVATTGPVFGLVAAGFGYRATFVAGGITAVGALVTVRTVLAARWARRHPAGPA